MFGKKNQSGGQPESGWGESRGTSFNGGWDTGSGADSAAGWGESPDAGTWEAWEEGAGGEGWGGPSMGGGENPAVLDKARLVIGLIFCAIGIVLGLIIYGSPLPMIVKIGLLAMLAAGLPFCAVVLYSFLSSHRNSQVRAASIALIPLALALLFGAGCLMQWLYSLGNVARVIDVDDYIFVIDDSESMSSSDPQKKRLTSLDLLLSKVPPEKRIGLVCFTHQITATVPLASADEEQIRRVTDASANLHNQGSTDIYLGLDCALRMCDDPERNAMLVLLTDGVSMAEMHTDELVNRCGDQGAVISTVSLSDSVNKPVLQMLADRTGGVYHDVDDLDTLEQIYSEINVVRHDRDLLGTRAGQAHGSIPLGALRVFAWLLIGAVAGAAYTLAISTPTAQLLQLFVSAACGLVTGAILELLSALWLSSALMYALALLPLGIVLLTVRLPVRSTASETWDIGGTPGQGTGYDLKGDDNGILLNGKDKAPGARTIQGRRKTNGE